MVTSAREIQHDFAAPVCEDLAVPSASRLTARPVYFGHAFTG